MLFFDPIYILFSLPALLLAMGAQFLVKYYYSKYSRTPSSTNVTGVDVVEAIARKYNLDVRLEVSQGNLNDHYNPRSSTVSLSTQVAQAPSIASVGIAAHEMGHAIQHKSGFFLMGIRNVLVPMVNIGTSLAYVLFLMGFAFQITGLIVAGIIFFSGSTIFTLLTLPVEIDASRRAMSAIRDLRLLPEGELSGVRHVLTAAALTYVAALMQSLSTLLYYVFIAFGGRRRD